MVLFFTFRMTFSGSHWGDIHIWNLQAIMFIPKKDVDRIKKPPEQPLYNPHIY